MQPIYTVLFITYFMCNTITIVLSSIITINQCRRINVSEQHIRLVTRVQNIGRLVVGIFVVGLGIVNLYGPSCDVQNVVWIGVSQIAMGIGLIGLVILTLIDSSFLTSLVCKPNHAQ